MGYHRGEGGSQSLSEFDSNCEIFGTGWSMELISGIQTLYQTIFWLYDCPKRTKNGPNWRKMLKKWWFEGSSGKKLWEQLGTKVEQDRGGPSQCIWTNLEQQGCLQWPKLAKNTQKWQFQVPVVRNGWQGMKVERVRGNCHFWAFWANFWSFRAPVGQI